MNNQVDRVLNFQFFQNFTSRLVGGRGEQYFEGFFSWENKSYYGNFVCQSVGQKFCLTLLW